MPLFKKKKKEIIEDKDKISKEHVKDIFKDMPIIIHKSKKERISANEKHK